MTDLTNQTFGQLTALYRLDKPGKATWHCVCTCGNKIDVLEYNLKSGHSRSCGCRRTSPKKDLTGQRFGKLVALYPTSARMHTCVVWHCSCDCGREADYPTATLLQGSAISCGCMHGGEGENLAGRQFGNWTVLRKAKRRKYWVCQCTCGTVREVMAWSMQRGASRSCGCLPYAAERRRNNAKELIKKNRENSIQGLAPGSLKRLRDGVPQSNNTSGVRGVCKEHGKWVASGYKNGKRVYLGAFDDLKDAREARDRFVQATYAEAFEKLE